MMAMLGGHVDKGIGTANLVELFCIKQIMKRHYLRGGFQQIKNKYG